MMSKSSGLLGALAVAFAALVASLIVVILSFQADSEFSQQSATSQNIIVALGDIREAMLNAETGQRGFLLTANPAYLEPLERGLKDAPESFALLETYLDGKKTASQSDSLSRAYTLVEAKSAEMRETISLFASGDVEGAIALVETNEGKSLMRALRAEIATLEEEEAVILASARRKVQGAFCPHPVMSQANSVRRTQKELGCACEHEHIAKVCVPDLDGQWH